MSLQIAFQAAVEGWDRDNFTVLLFRLLLKSDWMNFHRLEIGFPVEAMMVRLWHAVPSDVNYNQLQKEAEAACESARYRNPFAN